MKEKPSVGFPLVGTFPSDRIRKAAEDLNAVLYSQ